MDLHVWLTYFVATWAIALAPGTSAVLSMSHGLSFGVRKTSATIWGLELGLAIILLISGAGVGALLMASSTAFAVVKLLGAGYLLWLGIKQWRAPVAVADGEVATVSLAAWPARQRFMYGVLANVTNPKGLVFMVAVLPQFIKPDRPLWLQLLILLVTTVAIDAIVMHGYAGLAASFRRWVGSPGAQRTQNRVSGGVLMAMGVTLAFVGRVARV